MDIQTIEISEMDKEQIAKLERLEAAYRKAMVAGLSVPAEFLGHHSRGGLSVIPYHAKRKW